MTKQDYIKIARDNPDKNVFEGYVYIGYGNTQYPHKEFFGEDVYNENPWGRLIDDYCGHTPSYEYYTRQKTWEEKVGQTLEKTMKTKKVAVTIEGKTYDIDLSRAKELGILEEKRKPQVGDVYEDSEGIQLMYCCGQGYNWLFYIDGPSKGKLNRFTLCINEMDVSDLTLVK